MKPVSNVCTECAKKSNDIQSANDYIPFQKQNHRYNRRVRGIGKCIREEFEKVGATVSAIGLPENDSFAGNFADRATFEAFAMKSIAEACSVDDLINNAASEMCSITDGSYENFVYALKVGMTAPFYLSKLLAPHFCRRMQALSLSPPAIR